ncbi:MAG: DUF2891 domain-containing protein [Betaproteobacteria bacterium]|nr:DUF2891 domain-containing protein [Betaproteobacteria bacterium]
MALAGVVREFPNKPDHVFADANDACTPRQLHPVFYGCYDWHSAVHSHWLLLRLWRLHHELPEWPAIDARLREHFQPQHLVAEHAYAVHPARISFERPYGWAWVFKLAQELQGCDESIASGWQASLQPLVDLFRTRLIDWLPRQTYPIRTGVHSNTAFMLGFALDFARAIDDKEMADAIGVAALRFYAADVAAPARWEPCGNDFLSPALVEADLMRRVLDGNAFAAWLPAFLPELLDGSFPKIAAVSDREDGQGCHLDGLQLSRAWCLRGIATALDPDHPLQAHLHEAAAAHLAAGLAHVQTGNFLGEHWLASVALYAKTGPW